MSPWLAPTARRTPISFVRSVTLTNITFMITIPPTTAEMELTMMKTAKKAVLMLFHNAMKLSLVPIKKSSSASGRTWRFARKACRAWSMAFSKATPAPAFTLIIMLDRVPRKRR